MKKSYSKNIIPVITGLLIILSACKKTEVTRETPGTGTGTVQGVITDLNNSPVGKATVIGGTASTTTDANGRFTLEKVKFSADSVLVTANKDGFFKGSKIFASGSSTVNNANIQLIPKPVSGTIAGSSGGSVTMQGGGSVNFASGFITASNGSTYSGSISVSARYLDPADQNFSAYAPGVLKAVSAGNPEGTLQSFGAAAVEITDASGKKLQLAPGKTATITLPIPPALQNNAPASVPLWYFDDANGAWIQEGTAGKQGSNYVGVVSHFTFWNAGDIAGSVTLTVTFIDSIYGKPSANRLVVITRPDLTSKNDYTDSQGKVSGLVPVNEMLNIKVSDTCGKMLYSQNIGPLSADTYLGIIKIAYSDCNPPVDPVADFTYSVSSSFVPVTVTFSNTSTNAISWIWDFGDGSTSTVMNPSHTYSTEGDYTVTLMAIGSNKTDTTAKVLHLVNQTGAPYINLTVNGISYSWPGPGDSVNATRVADTTGTFYTHIQIGSPFTPGIKSIVLNIYTGNNTSPGSYPASVLTTLNDTTYTSSFTGQSTVTTNLTEYGMVNGYITGTVSGNLALWNGSGSSNPVIVPFSCSYRARRMQ